MSVVLKGRNGNEFELAFVRDSLPEVQDGQGDSSWFTVVVRGAAGDDSWEETSPCLSSFEFRSLVDWLEAIGRGAEGEMSEIDLLEPELNFSITGQEEDAIGIRIGFHLPDRPEEFGVDGSTDRPYIDLFVERDAALSAAASLREALNELDQSPRDDILAEGDLGIGGVPSIDLNLIDSIETEPPFAGDGEDNAGNR
jgi:hypothetical protein